MNFEMVEPKKELALGQREIDAGLARPAAVIRKLRARHAQRQSAKE